MIGCPPLARCSDRPGFDPSRAVLAWPEHASNIPVIEGYGFTL